MGKYTNDTVNLLFPLTFLPYSCIIIDMIYNPGTNKRAYTERGGTNP